MQIGAADRSRRDLQDQIARIDDNKGRRSSTSTFSSFSHQHRQEIAKIWCKSPAAVQKRREAPRDNWLCSILVRPSGNSLKVIARPVKTSDASFDQRGREDPQSMADHAALDSRRRPGRGFEIKSYRSWSHSGALSKGASDNPDLQSHALGAPTGQRSLSSSSFARSRPVTDSTSLLLSAREAG